jgi:cytochrome c-type biogenesis protein CcmH/NrfG
MENDTIELTTGAIWKPLQTYTMATVCLTIGIAVGYLVRGSAAPNPPVANLPVAQQAAGPQLAMGQPQKKRSLEEMKQMADKQAQPLLTKAKEDPKNAELLNQTGNLYRANHQFKTAAGYYQKALAIDPSNVGARTDLASCLYYTGDVDGAIAQLHKSLKHDPNHAGALFNLGMIEWQGKGDSQAAIATWERLLKLHPDYPQKDAVLHLIDAAKQGKPKTTAAVTQ